MLNENTYDPKVESAWMGLGASNETMIARLNELDRRAVDILLAGEPQDANLAPAVLDRVAKVRDFLSLLGAMPAEEPSHGLVEATLRKVAASTVVGGESVEGAAANV